MVAPWRSPEPPDRRTDGRWTERDPLSRAGIADLLRASVTGMDDERAKRIRKSARILEGRERPGEVRQHRRGTT
jgi:hypothetical protein